MKRGGKEESERIWSRIVLVVSGHDTNPEYMNSIFQSDRTP